MLVCLPRTLAQPTYLFDNVVADADELDEARVDVGNVEGVDAKAVSHSVRVKVEVLVDPAQLVVHHLHLVEAVNFTYKAEECYAISGVAIKKVNNTLRSYRGERCTLRSPKRRR